jgi:hypothetical protein
MLFDLKIKHVFVFPYSNPLDALRASVPLVRGTIIDSAPLTRGATGGCLEV